MPAGPQQREIGTPISTNNASWGRGPNTKAGGKSAYINVQVGVGQRNKFCKNIISVPLPPIFKYTLAVVNDKEPLHHKSLMVLYQFLPPSYVLYF
ncbi:hypothetical protein D7P23_10660 [Staphylococcus aureus]|nr:hypothetical protein C7Q20_08545 [Staphylococcus aureus]PZK43250.1 hypothetical protein C7Q47_11000 [Staphylococcus aureus]PZK58738.1 hypothetical protein C7Q50_09555 [Staphylococcus aureus]PZL51867.1 hypothetical protein C7P91_09885 [Staphylococcus aureus]QFK04842.1 hypothetical protein DQV87_10910 [Staphylococcus aureus]